MNNEPASSLPIAVAVLFLIGALLLLRTIFPDAVQSGAVQFFAVLPIVAVLWKTRINEIRCPRKVLGAGLLGIAIIASIPLAHRIRAQLAPPSLVVARFDGDFLGSATARFSEQLIFQFRRHNLPRTGWTSISRKAVDALDWRKRPSGEESANSPLLIVHGTERRLQVTMPPARSVLLPSLANPSLAPFLPPLKLWGGGVSFGLSVEQFGATAEFLTLLIDGMLKKGELGDLSLIDAGKMGGFWTSLIHRAVPLLLVSERLIARAVAGDRLQESYLNCASRHLSRAISLGDFSRDRELQAALYTNYGVVLWLRWMLFRDKIARQRALVLWRAVVSSPHLNAAAKEAAIVNQKVVSRLLIQKKKQSNRRKRA